MKRFALLLLLMIVVIFSSFVSGYYLGTKGEKTLSEIEDDVSESELCSMPVIDNYLNYSLMNDWNNVLPLLSGEALINATNNSARQVIGAKLLETEIFNKLFFENYHIVDVRFIPVQLTANGDLHDELFYRFYLKDGRIFKVMKLPFAFKQDVVYGSPASEAEKIVKDYLYQVRTNDWKSALNILTGNAREAGLKNINIMPGNIRFDFTDLEVRIIGSANNMTYVEADYKTEENRIKALFEVKEIRGRQYISDIVLVEIF